MDLPSCCLGNGCFEDGDQVCIKTATKRIQSAVGLWLDEVKLVTTIQLLTVKIVENCTFVPIYIHITYNKNTTIWQPLDPWGIVSQMSCVHWCKPTQLDCVRKRLFADFCLEDEEWLQSVWARQSQFGDRLLYHMWPVQSPCDQRLCNTLSLTCAGWSWSPNPKQI